MTSAAEQVREVLPSPCIRPISDVRTKLSSIEREAREGRQVILNRNGEPALIVLGYDEYVRERELERHRAKIREAEIWERAGRGPRASLTDVLSLLDADRAMLHAAGAGEENARG